MSDENKSKIIIDEDWKSQVQAEKEAAQSDPNEPSASESQAAEHDFPDDPDMPPASFDMLISGLATEAMMAMGQIPNPITGEATVRRNKACCTNYAWPSLSCQLPNEAASRSCRTQSL